MKDIDYSEEQNKNRYVDTKHLYIINQVQNIADLKRDREIELCGVEQ